MFTWRSSLLRATLCPPISACQSALHVPPPSLSRREGFPHCLNTASNFNHLSFYLATRQVVVFVCCPLCLRPQPFVKVSKLSFYTYANLSTPLQTLQPRVSRTPRQPPLLRGHRLTPALHVREESGRTRVSSTLGPVPDSSSFLSKHLFESHAAFLPPLNTVYRRPTPA